MTAIRVESGGRIERSEKLDFTWDGKPLSGYQGDSLASALLANNEWVLGRSFKYHRPRGVMSAGVEESGAIVTVGEGARREPNVRATTQALYQGLVASGQNAWPNVRYDINAVSGLFGRWLAAGFYYKTFMGLPPFEWGKGTCWWMKYEAIIRKAAGMGIASRQPDPDSYDHAHSFCDVLVVGSGPAGLSAALACAQAGLDVWLVEQDQKFGGDWLNNGEPKVERQCAEMVAAVQAAGVTMMPRTTAFGLYDNNTSGLLEQVTDHLPNPPPYQPRQRFWTLRSKHTIVATGAIERTIAFGNNDRPGVMLASAGRTYLNRYAVLAGQNIVIATNNDSAYNTAIELGHGGARVNLIDSRVTLANSLLRDLGANNIGLQTAAAPVNVRGDRSLKAIDIATTSNTKHQWVMRSSQECDLLLVSGGWSPVVNLVSQRGIKPQWHAKQACFVVPRNNDTLHVAGSAAAIWLTEACINSGQATAAAVIKALGGRSEEKNFPAIGGWKTPIVPLYEVRINDKPTKALVDPQHDVTSDDIRLAVREGFVSVEHLKRYTTLGMATDGGKFGNVIGLALMADALGKPLEKMATTTFRPPYTPVAIGALKGRHVDQHFRPLRRTPLHDWHLAHGASMQMAGLWHRPWYFAQGEEGLDEAYIREATTVRKTVGLCDVTSLGKIAIQGADASELLDRVYTNPFAKLPVGKVRYGIMLRDDGIVLDDGTTWRLSETDYFMTTTTAQAGTVMAFLEELLQTRWQDLRVTLTSVTEQWAGCAIAGPLSRQVLEACVDQVDAVSDQALPFMGVREMTLKGEIPVRIARISFSGEMAYEAYCPADYAPAMMDRLWSAAQESQGCLYGLETLGTLRIEKGHVTSAELDGRVSIDDAGLGKMAASNKSYIGRALRQRPALLKQDRPQLVGIKPVDTSQTFCAGAIICQADNISGMGKGWVTAVTHSPALGHWIGLGFVEGSHEAWQGQSLVATDPARGNPDIAIEVVSPHMYDPNGEKLHG